MCQIRLMGFTSPEWTQYTHVLEKESQEARTVLLNAASDSRNYSLLPQAPAFARRPTPCSEANTRNQ